MSTISTRVRSRVVLCSILLLILASLFIFKDVFAATSGTILPKADGNYLQWTPSTGTSHYSLVNESACNGVTNYNSTLVVANRDSYVISTSTIPNGATITQIDVKPCASRDGTGSGSSVLNVFYRFAGINSADAGSYTFTSGNTPIEQATTTYSGLSLVQTSTTTLEVGGVYTSGTKGVRLSRIATIVTYTALTPPVSLTGSASTTSAIAITWIDTSSNESGFTIDRSLNGLTWTALATTSSNVISYYDAGLATATKYYYRVRAFNYGASSAYSNTTNVTTLDTPPLSPSGLSATASTSTPSITLDWFDNSSNETNFEVLRGTDGIAFSHAATTSSSTVSYLNSGLASTTTYYYQVRAYNSGGYSNVSNTASSTTP